MLSSDEIFEASCLYVHVQSKIMALSSLWNRSTLKGNELDFAHQVHDFATTAEYRRL